MSQFASNFWGTDFCGTQGFDTLMKRMKDGKKMCTDFEDYLEKWARAEDKFGKDLIALAKQSHGKEEIGTLRKSWDHLKSETEKIGRLHIEMSQKIVDEIDRSVKEFRTQQKEIRKRTEDSVKKTHQTKKKAFERNQQLKSSYEGKCRELDKAEENQHRLQTNPQAKPTDIQKADRRVVTCRSSMENADSLYIDAVRALEDARQSWEREMELLCQQFQQLDEQRIAFLRHTIWQFTNTISQNCVDVDSSQEDVRKTLEACDLDADIDLFVQQKSTGGDRPAPIGYENYYNPKAELPKLGSSPSNDAGGGVAEHHQGRPLPRLPDDAGPDGDVYSEVSEGARANLSSMPAAGPEGLYNVPIERVVAIYDYDAQGGEELDLRDGDIVTVLTKEDATWWRGELNGKQGMFPRQYVEVLGARV